MGSTSILIVEDDHLVRARVAATLRSEGYAVLCVHSAEAAEGVLKTRMVDLIVLDITLPGRSGLDFLAWSADEYPEIAIVMASAHDDLENVLAALRGGASDYITKPIRDGALISAVSRVLTRRRHMVEHFARRGDLERLVSERTIALQETLERLNDTHDATIKALGAAIGLRNPETHGHCERVVAYSVRIAEAYGDFDQQWFTDLKRGAFLHDIGKIGTPDAVLLKPGPLTTEERATIQQHPVLGARMLAGIPFLRNASLVVLHHHERFDGNGYPAGLAGEDIPLAARIFAIADAVDVMTSPRAYHEPEEWAMVRAEVERCSGTQFDPRVVDAFLSIDALEWDELASQTRFEDPVLAPFSKRTG